MKVDLKKIKIEFISYLKNERGLSDYTLKSYQNDVGLFIDYCAKISSSYIIDLDSIKTNTIRGFISKEKERVYMPTKKSYSENTVNRRLASIKSFFKYLYNFEKIKYNPAVNVSMSKVVKRLPNFVREDDINTLMEIPIKMNIEDKRNQSIRKYITNEMEAVRDQAILETLYATGFRLSEILSINICDIDLNNEMVKVMGKGNKERIVPIGKVALNSIENYLNKLGKSIKPNFEDPLFVNKKGKRMARRTLQSRIKKYLHMAMKGGTVHTLRHTFATHLLDRGADILTIKELLGHSSLSATQRYTQLNPETIKKVYQDSHPYGG